MVNRFLKALSMFLVFVLLVNMLPLGIFAEEFVGSLSAQETVTTPQAQKEDTHVVAELADKRTQYTKEFLLSNGLHMATVYADPVHYEKDGNWEDIDNTLVASSDGTLRNTAGAWNVSFPNQLSRSNSISIEKDGYTLSFNMAGELRSSGELMTAAMGTATTEQLAISQMQASTASIQQVDTAALKETYKYPEAAPTKLGSQLRYNGVYTNTDVIYDLQSDTVKESIVMDTYSSTLRGYRYTLNVGQMIPVLDEWGDITFYAPDGETAIMTMPAPFMMDANNEYNDDIQVQLTGKDGTYTLTYLLPQQWLAAEDRAWPVILDPVVKASRDKLAIRDQTVCELQTISETKTVLDAGYEKDRGKVRAYLKYLELPPLTSSDVVIEATFTLHKVLTSNTSKTVEVHKVTGQWPEESLTWANQPAFEQDISDFRYVKSEGLHSWKVTEIVRSWYTEANNGLMIKMSNDVESGSSGDYFRQFYSSDTGKYNRPTLQVVFQNNNGIEDYWDYTTTSAGRAGTGYVNNFTGNLGWIRTDMGFDGNRMPVTIQHVYNANDAIVHEDVEGEVNNANDSGGNYFGLGIGWRTNFHERVFQWVCDDATGDGDYFIWEDGDGTDHYFKKSSTNTYKDEDGLEMTLKTNLTGDWSYSIKTKKGYTRYFDSAGRLAKIENNQQRKSSINISYVPEAEYQIDYITDGAGRKYDFAYEDGLLSSITYLGKGTTALQTVSFGYDEEQLVSVTDQDGEASGYAYNADGILKSATDIDGYTVLYEYTRPDIVSTGTADWEPPYLVKMISTEYPDEESGEDSGAEGTEAGTGEGEEDLSKKGGILSFTYGYNETRMEDHNGNVQILQYNDYGNLVSIMDDEGHAQSAQYAANAHTDTGKANQLTLNSKLQNTVANLLNYSSFESGNAWTAADSASSGTVGTAQKYFGKKSLLVKGSVNAPVFAVPAGETYTLSAYVRADDAAAIGFQVGGATVSSTAIPVSTEWTRYEVSYTNNTGSAVQATPQLSAGSTKGAYFDGVQLENMPTASRYNLVENGDFRFTNGWTKNDYCTSLDLYIAPEELAPAAPQLDGNYFSITGNRTKTKGIQQNVVVSGAKGDSYVLGGWAEGYAVPLGKFDGDTRNFAVRARFKYTDGTYSDYFYASFQPTIHGRQFSSVAMVAKKAYSQITVAVVYHHNVNTIYLDGIQLFKEEYGTSYTYDDDGNVISVVDLQKKNTEYEYSNNDLTKIIENDKTKVTYTYDDYHNVKTAKTEEGLEYSFDYDRFGNNTKVTIGSGNTTISSEAHYNDDGIADNDDTSDDGNRLLNTVDALDKVTSYGYNENTNILEWVQNPEDTTATRTQYTYDSMYRAASVACTTDTGTNMSAVYTYTDDYLTSVATPTTTYHFNYGDFGNRTSVKVGTQELVGYEYINDRNKYLTAMKYGGDDGTGNGKAGTVRYTYDAKGRLITQTYEDGDTVTYQYDNSGALAAVTDSATGITTKYYYDFTDRLLVYEETGTNHSLKVGYAYDTENNLSGLTQTINGTAHTATYTYDDDNRITSMTADGVTVEYSYDGFGRVTQQVTKQGETTVLTESFTYTTEGTKTSGQIATYTTVTTAGSTTYTYTYDGNGNILSVSDGTNTTSYVYDSQNQLLRENNQAGQFTHTWEYDNAGNILFRYEYTYTTGELGTPTDTVAYTYGNENWGDLLTAYDGSAITYDEIGNPDAIAGWNFEWEHGRQLASMYTVTGEQDENGNPIIDTQWNFIYNADGLRTKRVDDGGVTYNYIYAGSTLVQMSFEDDTLFFNYDIAGAPLTLTYNGTTYYYATNLQGDIVAILDSTGTAVVTYTYDAWGKPQTPTGTMAATLGQRNPLRYRGYVYDIETGLYYLQSRYYNPEIGRFINADALVATGHNFTGNNMFLYCYNAPVSRVEISGYISEEAAIKLIDENAAAIKEAAEDHGVDPAIIAACIYTEQVLNVNLWDAADVLVYFFDTSIGVGQVKVSTAILLEDLGYVEKTEPVKFWFITITSRRKRVAEKLNDNKTNIEYVAAYLEYWQDQWEDTLDISQMPEILGTLYNLGVNAKAPNTSPKPNNFGTHVKTKYDMLKKRLG